MPVVKTFGDLRKLPLTVKSIDDVQITKSGGLFKARFHGHKHFVFGATAEQAKQRLLSGVTKRLGIAPIPITNFEKQLLEAVR